MEENKCGEEEDLNSIQLRTVHRKKALTCSTIIQPHERANDPTKPQIKTTYELFTRSDIIRIRRPAMPAIMSKIASAPLGISTVPVSVFFTVMHAGFVGPTPASVPVVELPTEAGRMHSFPLSVNSQKTGMHRKRTDGRRKEKRNRPNVSGRETMSDIHTSTCTAFRVKVHCAHTYQT